jgi:hypothetical protein
MIELGLLAAAGLAGLSASFGRFWPCCCGGTTNLCVVACGAVLPGATITVVGVGSCVTNSFGCCQITGLTPGTYTVTIAYGGATTRLPSTTITAGTNTFTLDCCIKICLLCCSNSPYTCGATVTLKNATSGATLASGTSDPTTGCIQFDVAAASLLPLIGGQQKATIVVDPTNDSAYATYTGTSVVSCSPTSPITISLQPASSMMQCCICVPINNSLTLTDTNGSWPFVFCNPGGIGTAGWMACYTISIGSVCVGGTIGTGTIAIYYFMQCTGPTVTIRRYWWIATGGGAFPPVYVQSSCITISGCPATINGACSYIGGIGTELSQATPTPPACSPFSFSGSLTPGAGNHLPDPVGGTVSIS